MKKKKIDRRAALKRVGKAPTLAFGVSERGTPIRFRHPTPGGAGGGCSWCGRTKARTRARANVSTHDCNKRSTPYGVHVTLLGAPGPGRFAPRPCRSSAACAFRRAHVCQQHSSFSCDASRQHSTKNRAVASRACAPAWRLGGLAAWRARVRTCKAAPTTNRGSDGKRRAQPQPVACLRRRPSNDHM